VGGATSAIVASTSFRSASRATSRSRKASHLRIYNFLQDQNLTGIFLPRRQFLPQQPSAGAVISKAQTNKLLDIEVTEVIAR
jgi:hypothetical protein